MRSFQSLVLVVALVLMPSSLFAQRDFSKVEIKATKVAGNVYMLEGLGGNIGVSAGPDGILIVDDQYAPLAEKIRAALKSIDPGQLKFVLNTHWHGDHTGGNPEFGPEAPVIAHTNVRKRLARDHQIRGTTIKAMVPEGLPVITFDESLSVHFNGEEIRMIHHPAGHTDGDSVIFFSRSNVIHMGDQFFNDRFPFIDLESGGSVEGYLANVEAVIAGAPAGVKIIPGHGRLATVEDLRRFAGMLRETIRIVRSQMSAGKSLDEIKAAGLPDWTSWVSGWITIDVWIETIHGSLSAKK
ncbi:MAG TPA: MBL fold metallo-hydrolase [Thermoanaerobaculia bacterium]|nr:MBL fold metallo-hydrolase [Thermoanaerobaculia bacterium]